MNISLGNAIATIDARPETEPLVLVVDDDESVRLSICELLESVDIETAGFGSTPRPCWTRTFWTDQAA
jgi:CheY-like chemotaxis protein